MRGSLLPINRAVVPVGIIPAHAGLTMSWSRWTRWTRDHPRACGAHSDTTVSLFANGGSSPRMRGSLFLPLLMKVFDGIIPAHAGLTAILALLPLLHRDHPRACGAHCKINLLMTKGVGSSPRMRGSLFKGSVSVQEVGIIPAHAGLTSWHCVHHSRHWDHPRACGAHGLSAFIDLAKVGSSPRMRGSQPKPDSCNLLLGIIPAHAGLTLSIIWRNFLALRVIHRADRAKDHPRACGAHMTLAAII